MSMTTSSHELVDTLQLNPLLEFGGTEAFWDYAAEASYPSAAAQAEAAESPMTGLLTAMDLLGPETISERKIKLLDVACGSGIVPLLLARRYDLKEPKEEVEVVATDFSASMVRRAAKEMEDGGWKGVKVEKMDAQNLTYPDDHWTHVTCSFGAMMMPEPDRFFEGAHRTLLPGGQLGFTVWKAIGWAPLIPAAVKRARPSDPLSHSPFAAWAHGWERAEFVQTLLARHGFVDVHMKEMGATLQLPSLEFLRTKVLGRISDELRKDWSEEEKAKWADAVDEAAREKGAVGEDGGVMLQQVA